MKMNVKRIIVLLLALCMAAALPFAMAEETEQIVGQMCIEGNIAFALCGMPTLVLYPEDNDDFTDMCQLLFLDDDQNWCCFTADAARLMAYTKTQYPDATEDEQRCMTVLLAAVSMMPVQIGRDDYEFVYLSGEAGKNYPCTVIQCADGEEKYNAVGVMDGSRIMLMIGPEEDIYCSLSLSSIHVATQEDRENVRLRQTPAPVSLGSVTVTMPALTVPNNTGAVQSLECIAEDYSAARFSYYPSDIAGEYAGTEEMENALIESLAEIIHQIKENMRGSTMTDEKIWTPQAGCAAFSSRVTGENGETDKLIYYLCTTDGVYTLECLDTPAGRAAMESIAIAEETGRVKLSLPETNDDNSVLYNNLYLGYSLMVPEWLEPMSDEENARMLELAEQDKAGNGELYEMRYWYYMPTVDSYVMLNVQLKESSFGSFEEEWSEAPMEAEQRNQEAAEAGLNAEFSLLFAPELIETDTEKMILRGIRYVSEDGNEVDQIYLDFYRNTIEYCVGFESTPDIPSEDLVRILRYIAGTVKVEDMTGR